MTLNDDMTTLYSWSRLLDVVDDIPALLVLVVALDGGVLASHRLQVLVQREIPAKHFTSLGAKFLTKSLLATMNRYTHTLNHLILFYRVFIKYCVFSDILKIFRTLFSLCVSVCTHTRQVEHQRCSRTGRVQKIHSFKEKTQYLMNTLYIPNLSK